MAVSENSSQATFPGGVYRHAATGQELVAVETEKFGNPMAAAFVRMGFEYVGPVSEKALASEPKGDQGKLPRVSDPMAQPEHNVVDQNETTGALEARLEAAKAREADARKNAEHHASLAAEQKKQTPNKASESEKETK